MMKFTRRIVTAFLLCTGVFVQANDGNQIAKNSCAMCRHEKQVYPPTPRCQIVALHGKDALPFHWLCLPCAQRWYQVHRFDNGGVLCPMCRVPVAEEIERNLHACDRKRWFAYNCAQAPDLLKQCQRAGLLKSSPRAGQDNVEDAVAECSNDAEQAAGNGQHIKNESPVSCWLRENQESVAVGGACLVAGGVFLLWHLLREKEIRKDRRR